MSNNENQQTEKKSVWYSKPVDDVLDKLSADINGLTGNEAKKRLKEYGPNKLPEGKSRSVLMRFLLQFHNVLIYVLMVAAAI